MRFIPDGVYNSIFDIDFAKLYAGGKRIILSDLDNTLATYAESAPNARVIAWSKHVQALGFSLYLISNNRVLRVQAFAKALNAKGLASANKPFVYRFKRFAQAERFNLAEIIMIGDQLVTDVSFARKMGISIFIVKTLDRATEKWYTRLNRLREKPIIRRIKVKHPLLYQAMRAQGIINE